MGELVLLLIDNLCESTLCISCDNAGNFSKIKAVICTKEKPLLTGVSCKDTALILLRIGRPCLQQHV